LDEKRFQNLDKILTDIPSTLIYIGAMTGMALLKHVGGRAFNRRVR
jgi:hypothetical protein